VIKLTKVNVLKADASVGITPEMVNQLAGSYASSGHRAPVVLGHPKDNSPAWGWVTSCNASNDNLYCDLEVTPEFSKLLSEGRFRERSVAFYDKQPPVLRHLGFLGATPPRIKGLEAITLSDIDADVTTVSQPMQNLTDYLKPVTMYALSESFDNLKPSDFKTEPQLNDDVITGVISLSDGTEYDYTIKKVDGQWQTETKLANPEVIELSERVQLLERQINENANLAIVEDIYSKFKLTEAILPKSEALKLLSEDTTGIAVKLLNQLPPMVDNTETVETSKASNTGKFAEFELAENPLLSQIQAKCAELGKDYNSSEDFSAVYNLLT